MNWIKKILGLKIEKQCATHNAMPSLLTKIILEYKTDLEIPNWNMTVFANNKRVGYLERGKNYGFWFISKIGQDIHADSLDKLKKKVSKEFENYRMFFSNEV